MPKLRKIEAVDLRSLPADGSYIPEQVEDVGIAFVEWAEKYWGIEKAYTLVDESKDANIESAPWSYIRETFVCHINEFVKNYRPSGIEPGYYKINKVDSV